MYIGEIIVHNLPSKFFCSSSLYARLICFIKIFSAKVLHDLQEVNQVYHNIIANRKQNFPCLFIVGTVMKFDSLL